MKKMMIALLVSIAAASAHAADTGATGLVVKALSCEIGDGKAGSVVKALKKAGAKPGKEENDYVFSSPIKVFGLDVSRVNVTPSNGEGPDSYIAIFPNANRADIAGAAKLKSADGDYVRDTKTGRLSADVRNQNEVWLSCTPVGK